MWSREPDLPSVEDPEDAFGENLPEVDEEWNEWWFYNTVSEKFHRWWKAYGGLIPMPLPYKDAA